MIKLKMKSYSHFNMDKNCNSQPNKNLILNWLRIRKLVDCEINFDEFKSLIQKMQFKKETLKIGPFKFIIHKDILKRKAACSIQPNKAYFVFKFDEDSKIYSHPDLRLFEVR